jgi:hypothetical protein
MIDRNYNAILSYNSQTKQYKLSYKGLSNGKEIIATNLADLQAKMTASRDFTTNGINSVINEEALLIPSIVYADWKRSGLTNGTDAVGLVKEAITNFYFNPSKTNYDVLAGIAARYFFCGGLAGDSFYERAYGSFAGSLLVLSEQLRDNISDYVIKNPNRAALARIPADPRFEVFSIPYRGTQR